MARNIIRKNLHFSYLWGCGLPSFQTILSHINMYAQWGQNVWHIKEIHLIYINDSFLHIYMYIIYILPEDSCYNILLLIILQTDYSRNPKGVPNLTHN